MNSKHIGADLVFALEESMIGTMDAELAVQIMYADELNNADETFIKQKVNEYRILQEGATSACKRGYVDAIISSDMVRQHLVYAFEMLFTKRESRPSKKRGTV